MSKHIIDIKIRDNEAPLVLEALAEFLHIIESDEDKTPAEKSDYAPVRWFAERLSQAYHANIEAAEPAYFIVQVDRGLKGNQHWYIRGSSAESRETTTIVGHAKRFTTEGGAYVTSQLFLTARVVAVPANGS